MSDTHAGGLAGAVVGIGVIVAACGAGGPPSAGVASLGKTISSSAAAGGALRTLPSGTSVEKHYQEALKFSECMRSHGVTKFPGPGNGGRIQISSKSGIDPKCGSGRTPSVAKGH